MIIPAQHCFPVELQQSRNARRKRIEKGEVVFEFGLNFLIASLICGDSEFGKCHHFEARAFIAHIQEGRDFKDVVATDPFCVIPRGQAKADAVAKKYVVFFKSKVSKLKRQLSFTEVSLV